MSFRKFTYDVALSFAEEDHPFVEEVVNHLKEKGIGYYYYKEDEVGIWGQNLEKHISGVYSAQARLCVIFISVAYKNKVWTQFEIKHAQVRAKKNIDEYLLPFKLDNTELPEISPVIKYLSSEKYNSAKLAEAIHLKVTRHKENDTFLKSLWEQVSIILSRKPVRLVLAVLVLFILAFTLWDRLTPVNILTQRIYDNSKYIVEGSTCGDNTFSASRGQGSCSSHFGVWKDKDSLFHDKTIEECHKEALEISWLPE